MCCRNLELRGIIPQRLQVPAASTTHWFSRSTDADTSLEAHTDGIGTILAGSRRTTATSTPTATGLQGSVYSRSDFAKQALHQLWARAEHADVVLPFASADAAISAIVGLVNPGECVLVTAYIGDTVRVLLEQAAVAQGVQLEFVPTWDLDAVKVALKVNQNIRQVGMPVCTTLQLIAARASAIVGRQQHVGCSFT